MSTSTFNGPHADKLTFAGEPTVRRVAFAGRGNGLVAVADCAAGTLLFSETPVVWQSVHGQAHTGTHCDHCGRCGASVVCDGCHNTSYCDRACLDAASASHHRLLCHASSADGALSEIYARAAETDPVFAAHLGCAAKALAMMATHAEQHRTTCAAAADALLGGFAQFEWTRSNHAFRTGTFPPAGDYMFEQLLQPAYFDGQLAWVAKALAGVLLGVAPALAECLDDRVFFDRLVGTFATNNQTVAVAGADAHAPPLLGTALFSTYATMNHCCTPMIRNEALLAASASSSADAPHAVEIVGVTVYAAVALRAGAEIFTSYINHDPHTMTRQQRREALYCYLFECGAECALCASQPHDDADA